MHFLCFDPQNFIFHTPIQYDYEGTINYADNAKLIYSKKNTHIGDNFIDSHLLVMPTINIFTHKIIQNHKKERYFVFVKSDHSNNSYDESTKPWSKKRKKGHRTKESCKHQVDIRIIEYFQNYNRDNEMFKNYEQS